MPVKLTRDGDAAIITLNRPEATVEICEHLRGQKVSFGLSWEDAYGEVEPSAQIS